MVEGYDAEGQGCGGDVLEAGVLHQAGEFGGLVEAFDGGVEVLIGVLVAREQTAEERDEAAEVKKVAGADEPIRGEGEFEDQGMCAGFEEAIYLGEGFGCIGGVSDSEGDGHDIEAVVAKCRSSGVALQDRGTVAEPVPCDFSTTDGQHVPGYVQADGFGDLWISAEHLNQQIPGAGCQIEDFEPAVFD